jgi:uncharacterized lipoprotein YddW (UPF0748 family)
VKVGLIAIVGLTASSRAEDRILWYSVGDGLTNTANIQNAINFAVANRFNGICYLARYRADAFYLTNRDYSTYANPEPEKSSSDPLQYVIDRGREAGLRIYVSFGCFLVTDGSNTYPSHLPSGSVTWRYSGSSPDTSYLPTAGYPRAMTTADSSEGLWADPGRNDVNAYTRNVLKDLVQNYDIDGVILDRIRYPGDSIPHQTEAYGYNPQALSDMGLTNPAPNATSFNTARRNAITNFISGARGDVHAMKPWIIFGAAPIVYSTTLNSTYNSVFQYFPSWNSGSNSNHVSGFGILDLIAPQYYRTSAATNASLMNLTNADIDEATRMFHQATFSSSSSLAPPAETAQNICDQRQKGMKGFGIFAYADTAAAGYMSTLNATATTPCGANVLGTVDTPVDFTLKVNWDSVKPNNITNLAADTSQYARVVLTWSTPAAASDGDQPVLYLVYRSASSPVKQYYANLVNRNFTVTGNSFADTASTGLASGPYYYKVVPVDDYNNKGDSNQVGPVTPDFPEAIIESRSGGKNFAKYSEIAGNWSDSTSKSTAAGLSAASIGSRYSTLDVKDDRARFSIVGLGLPNGTYDVFYTTNNASSTVCAACTWRVMTASGLSSGTFNVTAATTGNVWYKMARST